MADTPVEVDVNTDNLDEFDLLFSGKAQPKTAPAAEPEPEVDEEDVTPVEDADAAEEVEENAEEPVEEQPAEEEGEAEVEAEAEPEEEDILKPRKKTFQERIDEITADKHNERRRAEAAEARAAELERQLRERNTEPKPQAQPEVDFDEQAPDPDALDEYGRAIYPQGEYDPKYLADATRHMVRQQLAAEKAERDQAAAISEADAARQTLTTQWNAKLAESEKTLPDLRESLARLQPKLAIMPPDLGVFLAETVMGMDNGPEVLYYLSNHPDETDAIVSLGATRAVIALGKLEAKVQSALAKRKETPPARVTNAPKPVAAVPRGTGGPARTSVRADTENLDEFEKLFYNRK